MKATGLRGLLAVMVMASPLAAMAQQVGTGAVSLAGPGAGASEDFNTLASAQGTTSSALPAGWYFLESANANSGTYLVDDGTLPSGNTYSYGASGSSERALGALGSGSVVTTLGAQLSNGSGATLNELAISFFVEQWRLGDLNGADSLRFEYSTDATALDTGSWTALPALNAVSPVTAGTAGQKLDGNLAQNRAPISATLTGLGLAPGATLWVRWVDVNDFGVDDALAIDDMVFGTPTDVPPTLASSTPTHNATDFPANAALSLTFSEPVDVSGVWFEIQCASSGYRNPSNVLVSGGPTQYFLTPATAFAVGESCELTLDTDFITDRGASAFPLVDPGTIHFSTVAPPPNVLPTVAGTVPANNASNFPSAGDLKATFSEPVIAGAGAFSLTCAASTGIALTPTTSDGGVNFTIGTGTALVAGDACTFVIHAAAIIDLDGGAPVSDFTVNFTVADFGNVNAYYQSVNLASPEQMRCSLYEAIKGHVAFSYSGATGSTWTILNLADEDPVDTGKILDVYKNASYTKYTSGDSTHNREHTWPRSYGLGPTGTPGPATDTHMLHLTDTAYNSARGNLPYAYCTGGCTKYATTPNHGIGGTADADSNWVRGNGSTGDFEPWDHIKGNMARATMYMAIRYKGEGNEPNLELTNDRSLYRTRGDAPVPTGTYYMGDLSVLLAWNQFDAPDLRELERNQIVQSFQNNRNPFVDHPTWARIELFSAARANPCRTNDSPPVAANDSYVVPQDATLSPDAASGVLQNDSDVEFDAAGSVVAGWFTLTAQHVTPPVNGTLSLSANGSFTYTPNTGFCGSDSFTYRASDGTRVSPPATVAIAVGSSCGGGFTVTATSGGNGTITPPSQGVNHGGTASFTVTPASGYHVVSVTGDTCTVTGSGTSYSAANIQTNCAVAATFAITPPNAIFTDGFEN